MNSILRFTGDPFVDAGVAVLEYRLNRPAGDVTREDLARQAEELESIYSRKAWTGYLSVIFPNSCWCNPTMGAASRAKGRDLLLRSFDAPALSGRACAYCARPAQHLVDRSAVPLLTGAATMTSSPHGIPGLPVCSACQYAIQFFPLATLKVQGKPLFWWTPHHDWMYALSSIFAVRVDQIVSAAPDGMTNLSWPATRLLEAAEQALVKSSEIDGLPSVDLAGIHATNYGSGPYYAEKRLRRGLLDFLRIAQAYPAYRAIRDYRPTPPTSKRAKPSPKQSSAAPGPDSQFPRNPFFEDLGQFLEPGTNPAAAILGRHFRRHAGKVPAVFELACLFSRKVLEVKHDQIEAIKSLANQIAASRQAEKFLDRLFQRAGLASIVRTLTDISDRMSRSGESPVSLNTVLAAFDLTNPDEPPDRSGYLVRELLLLRLIEVLPQEKLAAVPELESQTAPQEEEA